MISIIMPVHNKGPHVRRSIESILNQTFKKFELIVINDCSTDDSLNEVERFSSDERLIILSRDTPGPGGYKARNLGIENASYDWVSFLDADDEWNANYLENIMEVITFNDKAEIISTGWFWKDERGLLKRDVFTKHFQRRGRLTEFTLKDFLLNQDLMWTGALTIKKGILLDAGLFPTCEKCRKGGDLDTWIRCLIISKQNIYLDEHLAIYYRDTVNRVTDEKRNQTYYLCSYETLNNLNKKTKEYNKEITHFLNKKLYNLAITKVRIDNTIDFDLIKKMKLNGVSFLYLLKLILVRFKIVK